MESSTCMVIKVKYGDTLRRFNSQVVGEELDLTMDGLRKKILSLFSFAPDTELTLTYIDEDGDVVGLVDDDDLQDVVMQALNPLRITVTLDAKKSGRKYNRSSGSSTPLRSPRVPELVQDLNSGISEKLRTISGPLCEALLKMLSDVGSKGSLSSPGITELVDTFSKVGLSWLVPPSDSQPRIQDDVPESRKNVAKTKDPGNSDSNVLPNIRYGECSLKSNETLKDLLPEVITENNEVKLGDVNGGNKEVSSSKAFDHSLVAKALESQNSSFLPPGTDSLQTSCRVGKKEKVKEFINSNGMFHFPSSSESSEVPSIANGIGTKVDVNKPRDPEHGANPSDVIAPKVDPLRKKYRVTEWSGSVFHHGIRCDGCGVHPITGPRFKSKVKVDYDLCSICFDQIGNDSDYIRMDCPVAFRKSRKGSSDDAARLRKAFGRCKVKIGSSKLGGVSIRNVDASVKKLPRQSIGNLDLNVSPITSPETTNIDPQPLVGNSQPEPGNSRNTVETVNPVAYSQLNTEQEMKIPISDNPLVRDPSPFSFPVIDPSDLFPPLYSVPTPCYYPTPPPQQPLVRDLHCPLPPPPSWPLSWDAPYPLPPPPPPPGGFSFPSPKAQSGGRLLRELKEIGALKQVDPNNEILGMPGFDFEQYLADDVANWDHSSSWQK